MGVESLRNGLLEDLNRAKLEDKRLNDQVLANTFENFPFYIKKIPLNYYFINQQCNPHSLLLMLCLFIFILRLRCFRTQIRGFKSITQACSNTIATSKQMQQRMLNQ